MADRPVQGVVKAIKATGQGWWNLDILAEKMSAAVTYAYRIDGNDPIMKIGDTISYFPKVMRDGRAMLGSPRVVGAGPSPNDTTEAKEDKMKQDGELPHNPNEPSGYAIKDASVCVSYAKDIVCAYIGADASDAKILDRVKYLAEGMFFMMDTLAKTRGKK
jgi:hypothetical protein